MRRAKFMAGPSSRGFTLMELLVVISVLAVLVSLALPSLRAARQRGLEARSLSTQRQLITALVMYAKDSRDGFPYFATPGDPNEPVTIRGFRVVPSEGYFRSQTWHWASAIVPEYFDGPRTTIESPGVAETLRDQLGYPASIIRSHYLLSYNVFAAASFWSSSDIADLTLLRPTRWDDVLFPSQKGLLLDVGLGHLVSNQASNPNCFASCADGSARSFNWYTMDTDRVVSNPLVPGPKPVLSTRDGLSGIDF